METRKEGTKDDNKGTNDGQLRVAQRVALACEAASSSW